MEWPHSPPTRLELWLARNFCHGPGHVLSQEALTVARRIDRDWCSTYAGMEGSIALRSVESALAGDYCDIGHSITRGEWLVILRALRNALQVAGHPWIHNRVTNQGLALSRDFPADAGRDPIDLIESRSNRIDPGDLLMAISNLVVCAYVGVLRRRVDKGQSLRVPSLSAYVAGETREAGIVVSGGPLEEALMLADQRMEGPTPSGLRFADDDELDVVPMWFNSPAGAFDDERIFGDPQECNPWWLGYLSFPRSFPQDLLRGTAEQVGEVRGLLDATATLARNEIPRWGTRLGILPATAHDLRNVPISEGHIQSGAIIETRRGYLVDLGAATSELVDLHEPSAGGSQANVAAERFEDHVQEVVDFTPWRPEGHLREMIGKKVRDSNGSIITDIDAVAVRGSLLVLIDCKNHALSSDAYREMRNRRTGYELEATRWKEKCHRIDQQRDVLGIPASYRLDGVVVVPQAEFMDSGVATEQVHGLPRVVGIWEMYQHLRE